MDRRLSRITLGKPLAPEDICPGDYVTVLHVVQELPSFLWNADAAMSPREELVRIQCLPVGGGVPLKVKSVCLPYVLVSHPQTKQQILDVRRAKLARLDREFAKTSWKLLKEQRSKRKKKRQLVRKGKPTD